jgi:hypothetical protein
MPRYQNTGKKNYTINIPNRSFVNMAKFKYWGMTMTNQNPFHEEIKNRLNY